MAHLCDPLTIRDVTFPNRIFMSPMCQYSSTDGFANDWHFVHLASRAIGGAGLVMTEATAVLPEGRISPDDLGLWTDAHIGALGRITRFVKREGVPIGIQLAHAGRKASTHRPFSASGVVPVEEGGWEPVGPSSLAYSETYATPRAMTTADISEVVDAFKSAANRAAMAQFDVIEIHAAHGYLLHEFLSPRSNVRTDAYGGSFASRIRLVMEVVSAVREVWPEGAPLFVRVSASDWVDDGWTLDETVELARRLGGYGVDLIDCSSGGNIAQASVPLTPGYQVPFAARVKRDANLLTGAVGLITTPQQANQIVARGEADAVFLGRELLRDPYWPLRAARELGRTVPWPEQYLRAAPQGTVPR